MNARCVWWMVLVVAMSSACLDPLSLGAPCVRSSDCDDDEVCVSASEGRVCAPDRGVRGEEGEGEPGEGEGEGEGEPGEGEGEGEPPACADGDDDNDGSCNGVDCDDANGSVHPGAEERCDDVDNNCNGQKNDLLDCTFVAHDRDALYAIDPFAQTIERLTGVSLLGNASMLDIDIDTDGTILTVTEDGIYEVTSSGTLVEVADLPAPAGTNGMAINDGGELFLTTSDGNDSAAYKVDRTVSPPSLIEVGGFSNNQVSSGDCVFTKTGDLLMSIRSPISLTAPDTLVEVDVETGATTTIGPMGQKNVYGLSASFGFLFGVNSDGRILRIEAATGASTVVFTTPTTVRFNGAANGD